MVETNTNEVKPKLLTCNYCLQVNKNLGLGFVKCEKHLINAVPDLKTLQNVLYRDTKRKSETEIFRSLTGNELKQLNEYCFNEALLITCEYYGTDEHLTKLKNEIVNKYGTTDLILNFLKSLRIN